jgi:tryptophanyl-tRNA synthetase
MLSFLNSLALGHLVKQNLYFKDKEILNIILSDAIFNLIEFLNKIEKQKIEYENEVNSASRRIGRFFKNKIYEFYQEMLEDVNNNRAKTLSKGGKNKIK